MYITMCEGKQCWVKILQLLEEYMEWWVMQKEVKQM